MKTAMICFGCVALGGVALFVLACYVEFRSGTIVAPSAGGSIR